MGDNAKTKTLQISLISQSPCGPQARSKYDDNSDISSKLYDIKAHHFSGRKHEKEGGFSGKLLKRRLEYRRGLK